MPYDSNYPVDGSLISAAQWRATLAYYQNEIVALKARVDALETSPPSGVTLGQVQAEVAAGVATCAKNVDHITPSPTGTSDPPTQAEEQEDKDNLANLITALHR